MSQEEESSDLDFTGRTPDPGLLGTKATDAEMNALCNLECDFDEGTTFEDGPSGCTNLFIDEDGSREVTCNDFWASESALPSTANRRNALDHGNCSTGIQFRGVHSADVSVSHLAGYCPPKSEVRNEVVQLFSNKLMPQLVNHLKPQENDEYLHLLVNEVDDDLKKDLLDSRGNQNVVAKFTSLLYIIKLPPYEKE